MNFQVYWKFEPAPYARVDDVVGVFKDGIQIAWGYTSAEGQDPRAIGNSPNNHGSIDLAAASAGPGTYSVLFYASMSDPYIEGVKIACKVGKRDSGWLAQCSSCVRN